MTEAVTLRPRRVGLIERLRERYLDILGSIYIYNEHRGYRSLDRVLEAVRARCPDDADFIAKVEKHRADEEKHYNMFKRWFELRKDMPYEVDRTCGHIDRMIKITFRCHIDDLDTHAIIADGNLFNRLCRVIMLTELRGLHVVEKLVQSVAIKNNKPLYKIFQIVEIDEPSHWMPYDEWLRAHNGGQPRWSERAADTWVNLSLVLVKLPLLYLNPWLKRRKTWAHQDDLAADARISASSVAA